MIDNNCLQDRNSEILRNKTMADKFMYTLNDDKLNDPWADQILTQSF